MGVAIAPDGRRLVSGGQDKAVAVWDISQGHGEVRMAAHEAVVTAVACRRTAARSRRRIATESSASGDRPRATLLSKNRADERSASPALAFTNAQTVAAGRAERQPSGAGRVEGSHELRVEGAEGGAVRPGLPPTANGSPPAAASASAIWDVARAHWRRSQAEHRGLRAVAFSPDGRI